MSMEKDTAFIIRQARREDAAGLLAVFAPYVQEGTVSFEHEVPSEAAFREKIGHILADYPFFVAQVEGKVAGYCYASRFRGQAAYDWAVETTIYIDKAYQGKGIGQALYQALEDSLKKQHVLTLYACISASHAQSKTFHAKMGYREISVFPGVGYKMGEWLDILWMEKRLGPLPAQPLPLIPFSRL